MSKWVLQYGPKGQPAQRFGGFSQRPYSIGRSVEADIYIDDRSISRIQITVQPIAQGLRLLANPESGNVILHNGRAVLRACLRPGDVAQVGTWCFTVEAETPELLLEPPPPPPSPKAPMLPEDPAGPLDLKLAAGPLPPPPRWRRTAAPESAQPTTDKRPGPAWVLVSLLAASAGLFAFALSEAAPSTQQAASPLLGPTPDLFTDAPPVSCSLRAQCVNMARDFDRTAERLLAQRSPDLRTLYQAARYLQTASAMTPGEPEAIAGLGARYRRVQLRFNDALEDARLNYELAVKHGQRTVAVDSLRNQIALFDKDKTHPYKTLLQRILAQLEDPSR